MIHIGNKAPDFANVTAYQNGEFKTITLSDYRGSWLVFFFYPRDFTFICPTELKAFAAAEPAFEKEGAKILAASTDSAWSHKAWFQRDLPDVRYPVLADTNLRIARDYGVLNDDNGDAERGLFIIDPEGIVKYFLVSASSVGRSVNETLRVLAALKSGNLCPIEWKPGEETLGKA